MAKFITPERSKADRAYYHIFDRIKKRKTYKDVTICDEWTNDKQSFIGWYTANYYALPNGEALEIDKDILVPGAKCYSPETCLLLPKSINLFFSNISTQVKNVRGKYQPAITGFPYKYDTEEEARSVYMDHKKAHAIAIADKYASHLPEKVYAAIISYFNKIGVAK